jgi:4-hydroxybenzoate polyprenyltransferase
MKNYLSLIKFSHTIFALPFALVGFFLANYLEGQTPNITTLSFILLCMVFARSAAMAFNRYLDRDIDAKNPRTIVREIPAGVISAQSALWFVVLNSFLYKTVHGTLSLCFRFGFVIGTDWRIFGGHWAFCGAACFVFGGGFILGFGI